MDPTTAKTRLREIETALEANVFVEFESFTRDGRTLVVALTDRLRKRARKDGVWRSRELFATLKNAGYGFDDSRPRSVGGRDGVFRLDRTFVPPNEMMRKLFDQFLDKPGGGADEIAAALGVPVGELIPVRLVSHHLRLLGVLARAGPTDRLVLVDCDR